jgi:hypothetical protein
MAGAQHHHEYEGLHTEIDLNSLASRITGVGTKYNQGLCFSFLLFALCVVFSFTARGSFSQEDFKEFKKQAERGDVDAEMSVGTMYHL